MMRIQKTTTAWVATGALGLSVMASAAYAFAGQESSALPTEQSIAASAVAGEQVTTTGAHEAAPKAFTAPSTATANTPASPRTANTAKSPVSPKSPVSAKSPVSPKSPVSAKSPVSPRTPNSPKSAPSARSND